LLHVAIQDTTLTDGSQDPGNDIYWKMIRDFEKGGVSWNSGTTYNIGDIAVYSGTAYIALAETINNQPDVSPAQWKDMVASAAIERGGVSWVANRAYTVGDVVSEGTKIYMRINSSGAGTVHPGSDLVYWQLLDTSRAIVGLWKNNVTYYEGDIVSWNGELYIAPAGGVAPGTEPPLAPWIDPSSDEFGGIEYDSTVKYRKGDMVSKVRDGVTAIYISTINSNTGNNPDSSPVEWELFLSERGNKERGGTLWSTLIEYKIGDVATIQSSAGEPHFAFTAIKDNTAIRPDTDTTDSWERLVSTERGGVIWDGSDVEYKVGDIVTAPDSVYGTATYTCIVDNISTVSTPPEGSSNWVHSSTPERGGIQWSSNGIKYEVGDIVSSSDNALGSAMFRCTNAHISTAGNEPDGSADWKYGYEPEKGGILFNEFFAYEVGQMVSVIDPALPTPLNTELRVYTCKTGHAPGAWSTVKNNWDDVANGGTF